MGRLLAPRSKVSQSIKRETERPSDDFLCYHYHFLSGAALGIRQGTRAQSHTSTPSLLFFLRRYFLPFDVANSIDRRASLPPFRTCQRQTFHSDIRRSSSVTITPPPFHVQTSTSRPTILAIESQAGPVLWLLHQRVEFCNISLVPHSIALSLGLAVYISPSHCTNIVEPRQLFLIQGAVSSPAVYPTSWPELGLKPSRLGRPHHSIQYAI